MDTRSLFHGWFFVTVIVISDASVIRSTPPDYCLHSLNTSDCGERPTPVAYYYKPGSRCEIATWKGCPTLNKFPNELICSHICIAKIMHWSAEVDSGKHKTIALDENPITEHANDAQTIDEWERDLESVPPDDMVVIEDLLNIAFDEDEPPQSSNIVKLKHAGQVIQSPSHESAENNYDDEGEASEENKEPDNENASEANASGSSITEGTNVEEKAESAPEESAIEISETTAQAEPTAETIATTETETITAANKKGPDYGWEAEGIITT